MLLALKKRFLEGVSGPCESSTERESGRVALSRVLICLVQRWDKVGQSIEHEKADSGRRRPTLRADAGGNSPRQSAYFFISRPRWLLHRSPSYFSWLPTLGNVCFLFCPSSELVGACHICN